MTDATETPRTFAILGGYADVDDDTGKDARFVVHLATPVGFHDIEFEIRDGSLLVTPHEGGIPSKDGDA